MTRKKVKLVWIVNDSARKASLKKRKVGLLKKVSELTTLCGVNAFVIIYSPEDKEPAMWPSRPVVQQLLARFQSVPEIERCKKMMNHETYLKERVIKVQEHLNKHQRRNKEMDVSHLMHEINQGKEVDDFNVSELHGLFWFAAERKKEIRKRMDYFQQVNQLQPVSLPPPGPAPVDELARLRGNTGGDGRTPTESVLWDIWFTDMMNNIENTAGSSTVKSDLGPTPHQSLASSSNAASHIGLHPGDFRAYIDSYSGATDMGLPYGSFKGLNSEGTEMGLPQGSINNGGCCSDGNDVGLGLQPHENINITSNDRVAEIGLGLQPHGNIEAGSSASSDMGLPSEFFAGSIAGSDVGFPYDVTKPWPYNFFP